MSFTKFTIIFIFILFTNLATANNLTVTKEFEWGSAPLNDVVKINNYILGYSQSSRGFYVLEEKESQWQLKSTIKTEIDFWETDSIEKISENSAAFISRKGMLVILSLTDDGKLNIKEIELTALSFEGNLHFAKASTFIIKDDMLALIGNSPYTSSQLYMYNIENIETPQLISQWPIPANILQIHDIDFNSNNVWLSDSYSLLHLSIKNNFEQLTFLSRLKMPATKRIRNITITDKLVIAVPWSGFTDSGYYYVDILNDESILIANTVFGKTDNRYQQTIKQLYDLGNNKFLLTYNESLMITDFSNPASPVILATKEAGGYYGKADINNESIYVASSKNGAYTLDKSQLNLIKDTLLPPSLYKLNILSDRVLFPVTDGAHQIDNNQLEQLINNEISSVNPEKIASHGNAPYCYVDDEDYIYGFGLRLWKMKKSDGAIVYNQGIGLPSNVYGGMNFSPCIINDGYIFIAGKNGHLWYVSIEDFINPAAYEILDFSTLVKTNNTNVNYLTSDGENVYAVLGNNLLVAITKTNENKWAKSDFIYIHETVIDTILDENESANVSDLDIFNDTILVTDNNTGTFIQFSFIDDTLTFVSINDGVLYAELNDLFNSRDHYSLVSIETWKNFIIGWGSGVNGSTLAIYNELDDGSIVYIQDIVIEEDLWQMRVSGDFLIGLDYSGSVFIYSLQELEEFQVLNIKEDSIAQTQLIVDVKFKQLSVTKGGDNGITTFDEQAMTFQPAKEFSGQEKIYISAKNAQNEVKNILVVIEVDEVNDPPIVNFVAPSQVEEKKEITISVSASDAENDLLTYIWLQTSGSTVIDVSNSQTSLTFISPQVEKNETYSFEVEVSDSEQTVTESLSIIINNTDSPISISDPKAEKSSGGALAWLILHCFVLLSIRQKTTA
jgi:hypothetical protein